MKSLVLFASIFGIIATATFAAAPPPSVQFETSTYVAAEPNGTATLTVTRPGSAKDTVSVDYATSDGSADPSATPAVDGTDYTGKSGTLTFGPGVRSLTIDVPLLDDPAADGNEVFTVTLSNVQNQSNPSLGATLGTPSVATVTIVEDSIQFTAATASVSEADGTVTLTVTRTGDTSLTVNVPFATGTPADPNLTPATPGQDYVAQSGVLNFAPGDTSKSITIKINDDAVYTGDRSFAVTLGPLDPAVSATLSTPSVATVTITDNEPAPTPTPTPIPSATATPVDCGTPDPHPNAGQKLDITTSAVTVSEDASSVTLTLHRAGQSQGAPTVHYATSDGTATAGLDYTATAGDVTWCNGDTADKTIVIPILDDTIYDPNETFTVTLTNPQGANLGTATATVTIVENAIKFTSASYGTTQSGGTAVVTVIRTGEIDGQVTVHYTTSDGTALAGTDYTASSGDVTFAAGESSKDISIPITDHPASYDQPKTFNVTLSAPTGSAVLGIPSTAIVSIAESEVHLSSATYSVAEDDGAVVVNLVRTGDKSQPSTVTVTTADGTAQDGSDYVGVSTLVKFNAGDDTKPVSIDIIDDFTYEGDETFTVSVGSPTGSTVIGKPDAAVVTIQENDPKPTPTPTATPSATPTPTPTPKPYAASLNISTRGLVGTNDNALIGGFIVKGTVAKNVIIRAIGPSLTAAGVSNALQDPVLSLFKTGTAQPLATSDNWKEQQQAQIEATGVAPTNDAESAIVATLQPGNYTAVVNGKSGGTGIALVEVYDLNATADCELANISTRGDVQADPNVLIGGFILGGGSPNKTSVIVRAIGPSLTSQGVANALSDPTLDVRDGNGTRVMFNDNWQDDPAQAAIVSANGIAPADPKESAAALTLPGGKYTAIVAGKGGASGVGLVEVYNTH